MNTSKLVIIAAAGALLAATPHTAGAQWVLSGNITAAGDVLGSQNTDLEIISGPFPGLTSIRVNTAGDVDLPRGGLTVNGPATLNAGATINGFTTLSSGLFSAGGSLLTGTMTFNGASSFFGSADFNADIHVLSGYLVGIGTSSPTAALHVTDPTIDFSPAVEGTQVAAGAIELTRQVSGPGGPGYPYIDFNDRTLSQDYDARILYTSNGSLDRLQVIGAEFSADNSVLVGNGYSASGPASAANSVFIENELGVGYLSNSGIGANYKLYVNGDAYTGGDAMVAGNQSVVGNLNVAGNTILTNTTTGVLGAGIVSAGTVAANNLTATTATIGPSGGTSLTVVDDAFIGGTVTTGGDGNITGDANVGGDLTVTGLSTLNDVTTIGVAGSGATNLIVNGNVVINGSGVVSGTWTWSDMRWKKNVATIDGALAKVLALRGVAYDYMREENPLRNFPEGRQIGFLAQEVEKVVPELVKTTPEGYKAVAYPNVTALLVEAMKQQQDEIAELRAAVARLEALIGGGSNGTARPEQPEQRKRDGASDSAAPLELSVLSGQ